MTKTSSIALSVPTSSLVSPKKYPWQATTLITSPIRMVLNFMSGVSSRRLAATYRANRKLLTAGLWGTYGATQVVHSATYIWAGISRKAQATMRFTGLS